MVDLTVVSIPVYFGTMAAERRYLKRRAATQGPSPADYTNADAATSLLMGVGSLIAPLVTPRLVRNFVPGRGRWGRAVLGTAAAAVAVTSLADRLAREPAADPAADDPAADDSAGGTWRRRVASAARAVRRVSGPTAVTVGAFAAASTFKAWTSPQRQWSRNKGRDLGDGVVGWLTAVAAWDFIYYWNHRLQHEVRGLWALHVTHHSSQHYNLSTALRQPVSDLFFIGVPYGLLARFGVRPRLIEQARALNLLYQYWIHTDVVRSIGPGEEVLNTPSHHRVHHGSNPQYLDRNHGSILIVWDRLFGTFEREDEPVRYGLTKNIETYNPITVITHEYRDILRDVSRSDNWRDRLSFVLRGPGWAYDRHARAADTTEEGQRWNSTWNAAPSPTTT